jgi:hypothetical protein
MAETAGVSAEFQRSKKVSIRALGIAGEKRTLAEGHERFCLPRPDRTITIHANMFPPDFKLFIEDRLEGHSGTA